MVDFNKRLLNVEDQTETENQESESQLEFSPQQLEIFRWVQEEFGHAIVIAVAGSGKTTTVLHSVQYTRGYVQILVFNKKIQEEIEWKLHQLMPGQKRIRVNTFHSHGLGIWRKVHPQVLVEGDSDRSAGYWKINRIFDELLHNGNPIPFIYRNFVAQAMSYAKQRLFGFEINMTDEKAWLDMVGHFELEETVAEAIEDALERNKYEEPIPSFDLDLHVREAINWTVRALRYSIQIAHEVIDKDDMLYMPLVMNAPVQYKMDWVFVDEAQDTNPARRAYARKILKPTGRSVWVGDPAQAIYGFTGADSSSLATIKQQFGAVDLPLTCSFRCPKEVVKVARMWVSHIEPAPNAPDGIFRSLKESQFRKMEMQPTDVILCRVNAPLIDLAMNFIRRGIPCKVEGADVIGPMLKLVDRWKESPSLDIFQKNLEEYREAEVAKAMAKGREKRAERIADVVDTLLVMVRSMPIGSNVYDLRRRIFDMFFVDDDPRNRRQCLTLSSIHKSKGREWGRVFWYAPDKFQPSKYARQEWQQEQEKNLFYVAATRSKSELYRVTLDVSSFQDGRYCAASEY